VHSVGEGATLVYDRHELIYGYGPLEKFERVVRGRGMREGRPGIAAPHSHLYHAEHDEDEERVMGYWEWKWSELREEDD
jgi:hypothetical protein